MPRPSKPRLSKGYWRVRIDGETHWLGKHTGPTARDAKKAKMPREVSAQWYRLLAEKTRPPTPSDRPEMVAGAVTWWQALDSSRWHDWRLKDFIRYAGREPLDGSPIDLVTCCAVFLKQARKLAPKTVIDRVRTAAAVLRWAAEHEWIDRVPKMPDLPKPVRKPRDIRPDVLEQVFEKLPKRVGRVLRFVFESGCRPSEACRLEWRL